MDLYTCTVNLFSKNQNQVEKKEVTATEIILLRAIHGAPHEGVGGMDPVINIKKTGEAQRTDAEERDRLISDTNGKEGHGIPLYREAVFRKAFPSDHIPLPTVLPGFEAAINPIDKKPGRPPNLTAKVLKEGAEDAFA